MPLSLFTVDELRTATDDFAASRFIGAGGCGRVFRGTLASGEAVAVKRWTVGTENVQLRLTTLMNELYTLGRIAHRNLLPVLGFVCQSPDLMLVTLHMPRGSLHDALHGGNTAGVGLDAAWRLSFLSGLAHGIHALHQANFVHRDIKSANVLIGDDGRAVLADAGVARQMRADADATAAATGTRVIGTDGYLDPEYLDTEELTYKSDVFSVGVVILEMLTGRSARIPGARPPLLWRHFRSVRADDLDERVGRVVTEAAACWGGGSPTAGPIVTLASLALRATAESSTSRPSINEVMRSLEEIQGNVGGGGGADGSGGGSEPAPRECVICLAVVRSVRFDCGHMMTCDACAGVLLAGAAPRCPQCRAPASIMARLTADPMDPTYHVAARVNVQPGGGAGGSGSSLMSDENILRVMCERCPMLQRLGSAGGNTSSWVFGNVGDNGARRVLGLNLTERLGDAEEVPEALWGLTALISLNLTGNLFTSLPEALGGLTALTDLALSENQLTSLPVALGRLTALNFLNLGENQLTSLPEALGGLAALTTLHLGGNQLTSLPAALGALTALTTLNLRNNQLTSLPAALGALTALTYLDLGNNQLTSLPAALGARTALTWLGLGGNQLTNLPAEWEEGAALERSGCTIGRN
jgi:serine/threonine protein kinase